MRVKNNSGSSKVYVGQTIADQGTYDLSATDIPLWQANDTVIADLSTTLLVGDGVTYKAVGAEAVNYLLGTKKDVVVVESPPFAAPLYRTKRSKTASITTVAANTSVDIDYQITEDRYVSGGGVVYTGAELGDYVTASVYDKDSVIPQAYRAALCEAWPVVGAYIIGEWIPKGDGQHEINTHPLNAKITAGLYLRITYYAANSGSDRKLGVNYYLTKKL